jgi:hypothetical protein
VLVRTRGDQGHLKRVASVGNFVVVGCALQTAPTMVVASERRPLEPAGQASFTRGTPNTRRRSTCRFHNGAGRAGCASC